MSTQTTQTRPETTPAKPVASSVTESQYVLPARHGAPRLVPADAPKTRVPSCGELDLLT